MQECRLCVRALAGLRWLGAVSKNSSRGVGRVDLKQAVVDLADGEANAMRRLAILDADGVGPTSFSRIEMETSLPERYVERRREG